MDKGIGFNRRLQLNWLDATAAFCGELDDPGEIRARLEPLVAQELQGAEATRKTVDILLNIWWKSRQVEAGLQQQALDWFQASSEPGDRLWLHYGLTLLYYAYFRECTTIIGQLSRTEAAVTSKMVLKRLAGRLGNLGSLERTLGHVTTSLRDWGILVPGEQRYSYVPQRQTFRASQPGLEHWLLACALKSHPAEELPFEDLIRLPALFPFCFTLNVHDLRQSPHFEVQRQGLGMEMVRLNRQD